VIGSSLAGRSARTSVSYDGHAARELATMLGVPRIVLFDQVGSTLDVAHDLGEQGAEAGTLVLADAQTAGRGRMGRSWRSDAGAGIWLTLIERSSSEEALGVLALRLALALAPALDPFAAERVRLKWPNDIFVGDKKLAGVLVEARWHGSRLDWLAIGVGINVRVPDRMDAASLTTTERVSILRSVVPALRGAIATTGQLTEDELTRFAARDLARGRQCAAPAPGVVAGIRADGALLVDGEDGRRAVFHAGSIILTETNSLGAT